MASRRVDTGIVQRGKSYTFTVALGMDVNGKQIRKTRTWSPPEKMTEKKADKLAKEAYIEFKNQCRGISSLNEHMRFKDLAEEYFKVYAPNKLKPRTAYDYEKLVNFRLLDYFGNKKLRDITPGMLSEYFCNMTIKKKGEVLPMAPATVRKTYTTMQSIFTFAVSQQYIKETPCKGVVLPGKDVTRDEKRKSLTEEELPEFIALFKDYSTLNVIVKTLLFTGMRSGEALGLQWEDIDFERRLIRIRHNLTDIGGTHFLTTPKTKSSKRTIFMNETLFNLLKEHRAKQHEIIFALGKEFAHPEMVFTSDLGNYKDRSALNTSFRRFLKGTDFEFMTLHCLRHSNATLLLNSGVDIKVVSEHLGHSDVGTTANIYTDVLDSMRRKTAEVIEFKIAK